jgi:hypothetical protein
MPQNPYREPFTLDTKIQVTVEKEVAEILNAMSENTQISQDEMVNLALRRYIATHSDYIPRKMKSELRQRKHR